MSQWVPEKSKFKANFRGYNTLLWVQTSKLKDKGQWVAEGGQADSERPATELSTASPETHQLLSHAWCLGEASEILPPKNLAGTESAGTFLLAPSSLFLLIPLESELSYPSCFVIHCWGSLRSNKVSCFSRILVVIEYGRKSNTDLLLFVLTIYIFLTGHHPKKRICAVWEFSCDDLRVLASV